MDENKQKQEELDALHGLARGRFMDKMDFDALDYLEDVEAARFIELVKELEGHCPACGEDVEDCACAGDD